MALVLTIRKNEDFYVGEERFVVTQLHTPTSFTLRHECSASGTTKSFRINDARLVEVLPNVFVSAGQKGDNLIARLTIEAPKEIVIIRGDKKRNPPPDKAA